MRRNYVSDTFNNAIPALFADLLAKGEKVPSRNGATLELPFTGITIMQPQHREILVQGRKHNLAAQIAETMWVLAGRNDIEFLERYLPRAKDFSDNGETWRAGYGPRLRAFTGQYQVIDQLGYVVDLLRETPDTRQAVISIWNPEVDTSPGKDIACNNWLHFLARDNYLDLHVAVRSNDMMWGWSGINVFEWSSLLEIVAGMVGLDIGQLHFSVSSFHLYEQHWEKAETIVRENQSRLISQAKDSPRFSALGLDDMTSFDYMVKSWFALEEEIRTEASRGPLSTQTDNLIEGFPEPMLRSWLRVIAFWWTGNAAYMDPLAGTNLHASAFLAVQPPFRRSEGYIEIAATPLLIDQICELHLEKHNAYGDSWCKRGEILGIMANIARKVDRLGGAETADESTLDTAIDLFVYSAKYLDWLESGGQPDPLRANLLMRDTENRTLIPRGAEVDVLNERLRATFDRLEAIVIHGGGYRQDTVVENIVATMLRDSWILVKTLDNK